MQALRSSKFTDFLKNISAFKIVFIFNLFLQSFIFLDAACCVVDALILIWSLFFLKKAFLKSSRAKTGFVGEKLAIFFIISCLITAFVHVNVDFPRSILFEILMILYYSVCIFIFYGSYESFNKKKFSKETTIVFKLISFFNTVCVFISFVFILLRKQIVFSGEIIKGEPFRYIAGIYSVTGVQRFTGFYENPNIAAFCSVISLIFLHMLAKKREFFKDFSKWPKRALFLLFAGLNLLALILSDSLSSLLFLTIYLVLVLFNRYVSFKYLNTKQKLKNFFIFAINTFLAVCILMFARQSIQESASNVINNISLDSSSGNISNVNFGRLVYRIGDGNGRLELWAQAIKMFRNNPILGIGISNINYYSKLYFGSSYGVQFPNFHNGYISILTCYGIFGALIFIILLFKITFRLLSVLLKNISGRCLGVFPNIAACIVAYLVYAVSEKTVLSEINIMGVFFWLMLGYAFMFIKFYINEEAPVQSICV